MGSRGATCPWRNFRRPTDPFAGCCCPISKEGGSFNWNASLCGEITGNLNLEHIFFFYESPARASRDLPIGFVHHMHLLRDTKKQNVVAFYLPSPLYMCEHMDLCSQLRQAMTKPKRKRVSSTATMAAGMNSSQKKRRPSTWSYVVGLLIHPVLLII